MPKVMPWCHCRRLIPIARFPPRHSLAHLPYLDGLGATVTSVHLRTVLFRTVSLLLVFGGSGEGEHIKEDNGATIQMNGQNTNERRPLENPLA
jgi:hypothetical protein